MRIGVAEARAGTPRARLRRASTSRNPADARRAARSVPRSVRETSEVGALEDDAEASSSRRAPASFSGDRLEVSDDASLLARLETVTVKPVCMGFEDFYAGWSPETPPGFSVSPIQGRMERRGGEPSLFDVEVKADGQTGEKVGYLCIVLPDDDEQFTIKVTVNCF